MPEERVVLSIEDHPDTIAGVADELRDLGLLVEEAADLAAARSILEKRDVDLVLVDIVIPFGLVEDGGLDFVIRLKRGEYGPRNIAVPFAILTAYPYRDIEKVTDLPGFLTPISKTGSVVKALAVAAEGTLPWFPSTVEAAVPEYIVQDVIVVHAPPDASGILEVEVGSWPYGTSVDLDFDDLPAEAQQEILFRDFPVLLTAWVNVDAKSSDEVMPHRIALLPRFPGEEDVI